MKFICGNQRRRNFLELAAIASLIHPRAPRAKPVGRTRDTGIPARAPALRGSSPRHRAPRASPESACSPWARRLPVFPGFAQEQRETPHFRVLLGGHGCLPVPVSVLARLYFQCPNLAWGAGPARPAPSLCLVCAGLSREAGCSFPKSPFASVPGGADKRSLSFLGCQSFIARGVAVYKTELQAEGSATRVKWCFSLGSPEVRQP